jgi:capsular exopolysaccharide synthesis family protein
LLSQNPRYEHRIIAITSAIPREGKSVTTLNLGCILAEIRHLRVVVVDADFRRSSLARMLNQPGSPGFAEVLRGEIPYSDAIRATPIPNLSFLPAGDMKNRPAAELLASAAAKPIFQRLEKEFHYVVVDTPPATTVTDIGIIGQYCAGVIIVIKVNYTDEQAAKKTVRLLQANNIPVLGCLLVGRDHSGGALGYSGSYYRYYSEYYSKPNKESKSAAEV